jgi:hypothetical protein
MPAIVRETHRARPGLISGLVIDENYDLSTSRDVGLPGVGVAGERVRLEQGIGLARVRGRKDWISDISTGASEMNVPRCNTGDREKCSLETWY